MSVILDVLGAVILGGLVLIMLITFQYQITETAERNMYAASMADHMEQASTRLNHVIGLAGLGIEDPKLAVVRADSDAFVFRSYWDYNNNAIGPTSGEPNFVSISLRESNGALGKAIEIRQGTDANIEDDPVLENMGYIFWVDDLGFRYFNIDNNPSTETTAIRAAELRMTFRRPGPLMDSRPLTNRLQLKCFLMNTYLQEGTN
ncbi:MAG: hypothetical protein LHW45_02235 [Candidatus Cloacimonetes bacterium]|nr:hypothetical protein [Candidatus Cloacimonadota bacterium]MDY0366434.1 hypothetical protein [Candidatus Syntrophosphaera sp.]HOY84288.1 hypothetical protein [Candidatus Syntrophosphaera sp.]